MSNMIPENSILIAEFDNRWFYAYKGNSSYNKTFSTYKDCETWIGGKGLEEGYQPQLGYKDLLGSYHESWNALIPICKKCSDVCYNAPGPIDNATLELSLLDLKIRHALAEYDIDKTYLAVVEFIKFYNKFKKK